MAGCLQVLAGRGLPLAQSSVITTTRPPLGEKAAIGTYYLTLFSLCTMVVPHPSITAASYSTPPPLPL